MSEPTMDEIVKEAMRRGVEYGFNLGSEQTMQMVAEAIEKLLATGAADKATGRAALENFSEAITETPLSPLVIPATLGEQEG